MSPVLTALHPKTIHDTAVLQPGAGAGQESPPEVGTIQTVTSLPSLVGTKELMPSGPLPHANTEPAQTGLCPTNAQRNGSGPLLYGKDGLQGCTGAGSTSPPSLSMVSGTDPGCHVCTLPGVVVS